MIRGVLRNFRRGAEFIELVDISAEGCGFTSRWPFEVGARVLLGLPGLEPWPGTIVWHEAGQGGVQFDRPLHPGVVSRFAAQIKDAGPSRAHLTPPEKD
ncbi:MAG: PilZ domain-containing protein [Alphaproteobacteria bacterium]|nr:MAG: PilZ domain-containing protein [Alphaproteobacteria bacterium]